MNKTLLDAVLARAITGELPSENQALQLEQVKDFAGLQAAAATLRDRHFLNVVTYSKKVFIPLTHLCRDVCHYCTFAQTPKKIKAAYMNVDEVLEVARQGEAIGCKEALFTLGEKPELRYSAARKALQELGFASTLEYVAHVAEKVRSETRLLPHINAGCMSEEEFALLRPVSASMGIMLETVSERLSKKGGPHYGSPDKDPGARLQTIECAGQASVPFTSGILIGIGETRRERIESLLALRRLHARYGHLQEIIVQNFRAKPNTLMSQAPEPDLAELLWTIAVTRLIFGPTMSIQAPPNLSPGVLPQLVAAGINDWGGVSPLTPDFVNPEAPWPHLEKLTRETATAGKLLHERLTIYPRFAQHSERWLDSALRGDVLRMVDAEGYPRVDEWSAGDEHKAPPADELTAINNAVKREEVSHDVATIIAKVEQQLDLSEQDITRVFQARGADFAFVCQAADTLRKRENGDTVSYVVTRNINYTNICYFKCQFCAFSKGKLSENLRGRPYDLDEHEISRRVTEAWARGATEVCMQGGIHPEYTGATYLNICRIVKQAAPDMHIHAFSPLEVWQGAATLKIGVGEYLQQLKAAGLSTLPGTAAEILDDEVRAQICPDKLSSAQWLEVMETAHGLGFKSTATIMFGHVERVEHWARHLLRIRELQRKTGGFTELVPLPFVAQEAPMYLKGSARKGPTFREAILMHAVARIALHGYIDNIQASWVKLGEQGVSACLNAGVNDLGGTLMNETITRAAGATHGEETTPQEMQQRIEAAGRTALQRTTLYSVASPERQSAAAAAPSLLEVVNTPARKYERKRQFELVRREAGSTEKARRVVVR